MRFSIPFQVEYMHSFFRRKLALGLALGSLLSVMACEIRGRDVTVLQDWQYRKGFDPAWLKSETADPTEWQISDLPQNFSALDEFKDYTGWITLRREIPIEMNAHLKEGTPLAFNAGRVLDVSRFFFNTYEFGRLGSDDPYVPAAMRPFLKDIPFREVRVDRPNVLYIALYTNGQYPMQLMEQPEVGPSDAVFLRHTAREVVSFCLLMIYFASGAYHLLLFARRPKDKYNFYFGLFAIMVAFYWFTANTISRDALFQDHVEFHRKFEHMLLFTLSPLFVNFITVFFRNKHTIFGKVYSAFCLILFVATGLSPDLSVMRFCRDLWYLSLVPTFGVSLYYIGRELWNKNQDALFLILGIVLLLGGLLHDILASTNVIQSNRITPYVFLVFVGGLAGIMANRFMRVTGQVEVLNAELERKVEERTHELQETLEEVQSLKQKQDGDYFLTSLLIQPLNGVTGRSERVDVQVLTRQKKTFEFRGRSSEIGGDLCVSDVIQLRGRDYTVFLNADAMGKSMQGAGGAIVAGTAMLSIIKRNGVREAMRLKSPELWLHDACVELQNAFETFDGSMLISTVLGLVDQANGTLYYVNAEHPWTVLLRGGRARFLEDDSWLRKVGVPGLLDGFHLHVYALRPGDVLIAGSDGRDDILVDHVMNEDENLFLKHVEYNGGDLERIEHSLRRAGELTDDLSLLRLAYLEDSPLSDHDDPELAGLQARGRELMSGREYAAAVPVYEEIIQRAPAATEELFRAACVFKYAGETERAVDTGERVRLRTPDHINNIVNLADAYRILGNQARALELLTSIRDRTPKTASIQKLEQLLNV